jgi:CHAT domain-containing protein/Tfp pilus assembly protein PilF
MFDSVAVYSKSPGRRRWSLLVLCLLGFQLNTLSESLKAGSNPTECQKTANTERGPDQNLAEMVQLEPGKPLERQIAGGQKHAYQLQLTVGQYAKTTVEQRGVDVVLRLFGPDGKSIAEVDYESRTAGREVLELVSAESGNYKIEIEPRYKTLPAGHYEIRLAELRAATETDSSLDQARKLHTQARREYLANKYDDAIRTEEKSLSIRERILGPDALDVAQSLFGLGLYARNAGDIPKAEASYLRALSIREKALGPDHPDVALLLHNLGYLYYYDLRDYDRAGSLYERSLIIKEKVFGVDHPLVAMTLNSIGLLEWKKKDYARAESYFQRSLEITEKNNGPDSEGVATAAHNLGIVYKESGDYAKGEAFYRRALQVWEKVLGKDHPRTALALESLGILYRDKGDYVNAEPFLLQALDIEEKGDGANHPDVANTMVILARLYEAKGDLARAIEFQSRAAAIEERNIALNLSLGSERQKLAYFSMMMKEGDRRVSLHVRSAPDDPKARDLALTMILQRKGRVLDALTDTAAALRTRSSPQDQELLDHLKAVTAQMAQLVLDGPNGETAAEHQKRVDLLGKQREVLEEEASQRSSGLYQPSAPVTIDAVRRALPKNAALLEFAVYHPSDPRVAIERDLPTEPHYVVYIVRNQGEVQWRQLGPAKEIDAAIAAFRSAVRDPERKDVSRLARAVDEKVMQAARGIIGDATELLISPDGELNLVPFAALVDEQGHYLIERYSITYLTSGRDLLHLQIARQSKGPPVVVGNPTFGDPVLIADRDEASPNGRGGSGNHERIDYSRMFFGPLPGVNDELRALKALLPAATFLTGEQASKAALQSLVAPSILHVATHGFFRTEPASGSSGSKPAGNVSIQTDNPLLHSGLALAGANRNGDAGILTALEASQLDLWGTKLVVLSACDTGLGEIRNGEGVYGLRRALVLAGAESQMMSLWPVSDRSTRDLMIGYYKALTEGHGRGDALREIQLLMLGNKLHSHPYYWASFIQTGEWASLEGKR